MDELMGVNYSALFFSRRFFLLWTNFLRWVLTGEVSSSREIKKESLERWRTLITNPTRLFEIARSTAHRTYVLLELTVSTLEKEARLKKIEFCEKVTYLMVCLAWVFPLLRCIMGKARTQDKKHLLYFHIQMYIILARGSSGANGEDTISFSHLRCCPQSMVAFLHLCGAVVTSSGWVVSCATLCQPQLTFLAANEAFSWPQCWGFPEGMEYLYGIIFGDVIENVALLFVLD